MEMTLRFSRDSLIGSPLSPKDIKDIDFSASTSSLSKKELKEVYKDYVSDFAQFGFNHSSTPKNSNGFDMEMDGIGEFTIKSKIFSNPPRTYKFLGMDIDEDLNVYIKFASGAALLCNIFKIIEFDKTAWSISGEEYDSIKTTLDKNFMKYFITLLKEGGLHSIATADVAESEVAKISKKIGMKLVPNQSSGGFKSVLLTLVHNKAAKDAELKGGDLDMRHIIPPIIDSLGKIVSVYFYMNQIFGRIDLWQNTLKTIYPSGTANDQVSKVVSLFHDDGTPSFSPLNFSGVSKYGGSADSSVIGSVISSGLSDLDKIFRGSLYYDLDQIKDILLGSFDTDIVEDVFELSENEMQALSVVDGMQYIDDDMKSCIDSYNMDDPEDRGLFVKSILRSYERNFKEFKPAKQYDVTESLADMVEKGDIFKVKEVELDSLNPDVKSGEVEVTSDVYQINAKEIRRSLSKVMKIVDKMSSRVLEGF